MTNLRTRKLATKILKVGSGVADLVVQMRSASPLTLAAIGIRALQTHLDSSPSFDQYLRGWFNANLESFIDNFIFLCGNPVARHRCEHDVTIEEHDVHGVRLAFVTGRIGQGSVWVHPKHTISEAHVALGRVMWETFGSSVLASATWKHGWFRWTFETDPLASRQLLESQVASDLHTWVQRFLVAGKHRTILLRGEPGTGKSSIMRTVASRLGGFCLRLDGSTLSRLELDTTLSLLRFLRPSIMLFDDLDRVSAGSLLSCLDVIRDFAKVTIASANYEKLIDPAARRPGRFDRVIDLKSLDAATVNVLIGADVPEEIAVRLRTLPVSYIDEFHIQREVLGLDEALASVVELEQRAREIELDGKEAKKTPEDGKQKYASPSD